MALGTELRVKKVLYREFGVCDAPQTQPTPPMNFSPVLRNPVDHINATVGELLLYKVKEVSPFLFYALAIFLPSLNIHECINNNFQKC